ncbi:hypothetical protein E8E12_007495 [Didymella heteroderae]|uniref:Uncharacterized protein n=1 Tax=Didymella heteroderae TaxID=1769908 RepID=A0A9P4X0W9_9PLEO|nr:hypothetical protein E8E12_007495 [Didymella heteroderae]
MAPGGMYQRRPGFEHEEGHPLPTSIVHGDNKIEYLLEVAVYKKVDWSPDEIITLALPFRPIAAAVTSNALVQSPQYPDLCIRGHHLDPRNDSKPSTLTRLKWATLSKYQHVVPEARFRIIARCPFLLTAGSTVPIAFAFYDLGHSPELLEPPRVYVRRIRVKLTSLLAVRVPYVGPTGEREVVEDIEKEILDQIFTTTNTVMRHGLQLAEIGDFNLPLTVLPSFKTYGLRLVYRIKVVVEGHCGQETFKVTALRDFCKIVCDVGRRESGRVVSAAPGTSRLTPAGPAPAIPIPEEQPPAYEQAPSYDDALPSDSCRSQGSPIP